MEPPVKSYQRRIFFAVPHERPLERYLLFLVTLGQCFLKDNCLRPSVEKKILMVPLTCQTSEYISFKRARNEGGKGKEPYGGGEEYTRLTIS